MAKVVEVLPDLNAIAQRTAELFSDQLHTAIQDRGKFTVALAGGSTPKVLYQLLRQRSLPLSQIHLFWGDERYVPADHPDSNERMVREAWLNHVVMPAENIHPMPTGAGDPTQDAQHYAQQLQGFFQQPSSQFPAFDLVLLGMGEDGHTASLFPHTPALEVCDQWVTTGLKDGQPRLTLTIPVLNQARCVIFMVTGAGKAHAIQHVFAPEADARQYPSRFIQPTGDIYWLVDPTLGEIIRV